MMGGSTASLVSTKAGTMTTVDAKPVLPVCRLSASIQHMELV